MKWERFSCLQEKEVINICDGRRLGCVCDLELDAISGKICTLIIDYSGMWQQVEFLRKGTGIFRALAVYSPYR